MVADLSTLKSDVAGYLSRSDLTSEIASEISKAIRYYQAQHFYFNETRDKTFTTVAAQTWYSSTDDADIGQFTSIEMLHITVSGSRYELRPRDIAAFEYLTDSNAASGQPYCYTHYNRQIGLYPIPDDAYTVRIVGVYMLAEPATDGEANNAWMVEAGDLIQARTLRQLYLYKVRNFERAAAMQKLEMDELSRLRSETFRRHSTGCIEPTSF